MRPHVWSFILVLTASTFAGCAGSPADQSPMPIWWSPLLELESLDAIEERMDEQSWPGRGREIHGNLSENRPRIEVARSCRQLIRGMSTPYLFDQPLTGREQAGAYEFYLCHAIAALRSVRPSRMKFLPTLSAGRSLFASLPHFASGLLTHIEFCRQIESNQRGLSWGDIIAQDLLRPDWWIRHRNSSPAALRAAMSVRPERWRHLDHLSHDDIGIEFHDRNARRDSKQNTELRFTLRVGLSSGDAYDSYTLAPLIRGDFDGDGFEDLALLIKWQPAGSYYLSTDYLVMTRTSGEGPMKVVNIAELLRRFRGWDCDWRIQITGPWNKGGH